MLIGAGIVVPVGGPGCWLLGPAWDTVPSTGGATAKPGAAVVGCDVAEFGLLHSAALLHLISRWAGEEGVLVARMLWSLLDQGRGATSRKGQDAPVPAGGLAGSAVAV